jgi:hypothetical protein
LTKSSPKAILRFKNPLKYLFKYNPVYWPGLQFKTKSIMNRAAYILGIYMSIKYATLWPILILNMVGEQERLL